MIHMALYICFQYAGSAQSGGQILISAVYPNSVSVAII